MPVPLGHTDGLNLLLDELDIQTAREQLGTPPGQAWTCQRRHPRYAFRVNCTAYFLDRDITSVSSVSGRTRNLSCNGIALLLGQSITSGEPVELALHVPDQPLQYMAGLTTFCRYAGQGYHEIGVSLHCASNEPIFSADPIKAGRQIEWFAQAVAARRNDQLCLSAPASPAPPSSQEDSRNNA